ncbi:hypothetical protein B0920_10725 [Massilia sp. KIM]|uniref:hypothetical protein n=1 Tax=Massilia sp. KIM TaxID=1955422 RepID=UPI00098FAB60|nr:hypothetical protein [Massilia sp. KIM]OON63796.1 hypothetical protein B0920_10725 [Massilia sp. KIM]
MMENSQVLPDSRSGEDLVSVAPIFYVVSRKKLAILYLATLGFYGVYWFYKNWSNYKNFNSDKFNVDQSIWPVARGIFSIFFTHALFREIKAYGRDKTALAEWNNELLATLLVLFTIASNILDRLSYRSIGSPYTDVASLLIMMPLLGLLLSAQHKVNVSCDDPKAESNSHMTSVNYCWIALGAILWFLIVLGLILPEA